MLTPLRALVLGLLATALSLVATAPLPAPAWATAAPEPAVRRAAAVEHVVVVSLDGLNPKAIGRLGAAGTPVLHRLMDDGAWTLNARTETELTVTLPNHTSMVTGRRIAAADGGHGVVWNDDRRVPRTVQAAAGGPVGSVFTALDQAGLSSAVFSAKTKFSLWKRSWPIAIDLMTIADGHDGKVTQAARRDLIDQQRALTFVHLGGIDAAGHARGFMSPAYLEAVRRADASLGRILKAVDRAGIAGSTLVVVTADHGGKGPNHADRTKLVNYRVPFLVRGPGVPADGRLYAMNPAYADPGRTQPSYAASAQPIRNGAVANLVTDALGLGPVPGSQIDLAQDLEVFAAP